MSDPNTLPTISDLNTSFFEVTDIVDYAPFRYESDGDTEHVLFMGVHIWRSDEDERTSDGYGNYEDLGEFLMREARKVLAALRKWEP